MIKGKLMDQILETLWIAIDQSPDVLENLRILSE